MATFTFKYRIVHLKALFVNVFNFTVQLNVDFISLVRRDHPDDSLVIIWIVIRILIMRTLTKRFLETISH